MTPFEVSRGKLKNHLLTSLLKMIFKQKVAQHFYIKQYSIQVDNSGVRRGRERRYKDGNRRSLLSK